ncbi:MAG: hydantoinase/oxoprolinase family protein [bacterium]
MSDPIIRVATDVGGTFTDLVCIKVDQDTGTTSISTSKSDTTPPNFEQGVLSVIDKADVDPQIVDFFVHGTTVVINALTERKGGKVGLITTKGFRDSIEIARGNRPDFFDLNYKKPEPFVPRYLRRELEGRIDYQGNEVVALNLSALPGILEDFRAEGVEAVAVCFIHSYANPAHEQQAVEAIKSSWPEISVVASHQITREWREYERTNTAVLSAYVQPSAEQYLRRLDTALKGKGFQGKPYIMQSNCGVDSLDSVSKIPITMVESGPASGFWGAAQLGQQIGDPNILALDIGGTTAKCSLILDGQVRILTDYWIERNKSSAGYPIMVPVVDLVEIGNGGGSIANVDEFGKLRVGPESAGALPGPAAYGKGGTGATTTDANLWLGRINPDYFCGGEIDADMRATETALAGIASQLGVDNDEAARGIVRIANNNMVNALKLVSLNRGFDPRDFTLVAFGGGGAMHAVALAQELSIKKVVIPAGSAVFSAWGMLLSDLRRDYIYTRLIELSETDATEQIEAIFTDVEQSAYQQFSEEGFSSEKVSFLRFGKFRYQNQEHTIEVPLTEEITNSNLESIVADFHNAYEKEYTYRLDSPVELVGIHLVAAAEVGKLALEKQPLGNPDASAAIKGYRQVDYALEGKCKATVYSGEKLQPGMKFDGPAIIESSGTTTVIHPQNNVDIDGWGNIHINTNI